MHTVDLVFGPPDPIRATEYRKFTRATSLDYGAMFEKMPPLANHIETELSEVVRQVHETLVAAGEPCTLERAKSVFDGLRNKKVGVLVFEMPCWRGKNYQPEGGAA